MLRNDRSPAWHRDIKWFSAIGLVLALAAATLAFSLGQLTNRERALPIVRSVIQMTLLPGGDTSADVAVQTGSVFQPGQPLMLLPGVDVYADPTEVPDFTVERAIGRIAGVLAERTVSGGTAAAVEIVKEPGTQGQIASALAGTVRELVRAELEGQLLPAGLEDGSRLADWRTQAVNKPGQPVQPIVGVFIYTDAAGLARMSDRDIGVLVVTGLADSVLAEGSAATREKITNPNLLARYDEAVGSGIPAKLHALYSTLLLSRSDQLAARLDEAKGVLAGTGGERDDLSGLLPSSQLAGLTPEQANVAVVDALAQQTYDRGSAGVTALLTRADQASKMRSVAPLLDNLGGAAHARFLTWTWLAGALSLVFLLLLIAFSTGLARLVNAGLAIAVAAAGGFWLFDRLASWGSPQPLPAGLAQQGVIGGLSAWARYALGMLPADLWSLPRRYHLIVVAAGGTLVLLAIVLWLLRGMRPRRRGLL